MDQLNNAGHRAFKDELYEEFARVGKALGSPKRLEILDLLAQKERSVQELADAMAISTANASQHLQTLVEARLVEKRSEGTYRYYQLADEDVFQLWGALRDLAQEQLPGIDAIVERYLGEREKARREDPSDLAARAEDEEVVVLDVRPAGEYEWAHLPNAVSIPIDEVPDRADELPTGRPILVYCRGPFCTYSDEAVTQLRDRGLDAHRMEPDAPDWALTGGNEASITREVDA